MAASRKQRYEVKAEAVREERRQFRARERDRINARRREMRRENPEKYRAQSRQWFAKNPEKYADHVLRVIARQRDKARLTPKDMEYVRTVRRDPCSYCGGAGGTWDHIEPVAGGGSSEWENATGACLSCNASKKDHRMLLWMLDTSRPNQGVPKPMADMPKPDEDEGLGGVPAVV